MGYTATLFLATMLLAPVVAACSVVLWWIARMLRVIPVGRAGIIGFLLLFCSAHGALYLWTTADLLVSTPARLQRTYLGETVAGPLSLVRFDQQGFQDPSSEWRYRLPAAKVDALRGRCRWLEGGPGPRTCRLYSGMDERWFADVTLEGDTLRMIDGLH